MPLTLSQRSSPQPRGADDLARAAKCCAAHAVPRRGCHRSQGASSSLTTPPRLGDGATGRGRFSDRLRGCESRGRTVPTPRLTLRTHSFVSAQCFSNQFNKPVFVTKSYATRTIWLNRPKVHNSRLRRPCSSQSARAQALNALNLEMLDMLNDIVDIVRAAESGVCCGDTWVSPSSPRSTTPTTCCARL